MDLVDQFMLRFNPKGQGKLNVEYHKVPIRM